MAPTKIDEIGRAWVEFEHASPNEIDHFVIEASHVRLDSQIAFHRARVDSSSPY